MYYSYEVQELWLMTRGQPAGCKTADSRDNTKARWTVWFNCDVLGCNQNTSTECRLRWGWGYSRTLRDPLEINLLRFWSKFVQTLSWCQRSRCRYFEHIAVLQSLRRFLSFQLLGVSWHKFWCGSPCCSFCNYTCMDEASKTVSQYCAPFRFCTLARKQSGRSLYISE